MQYVTVNDNSCNLLQVYLLTPMDRVLLTHTKSPMPLLMTVNKDYL